MFLIYELVGYDIYTSYNTRVILYNILLRKIITPSLQKKMRLSTEKGILSKHIKHWRVRENKKKIRGNEELNKNKTKKPLNL